MASAGLSVSSRSLYTLYERVRTNARRHMSTHTLKSSDRHTQILIMPFHRLLSKALCLFVLEENALIQFFFKTEKQPKANKNVELQSTRWWWAHINEHITHKHTHSVLQIIHSLTSLIGVWIGTFKHKKYACVCAAQTHTNTSLFASTVNTVVAD